jgi:sialidase-1
MLPLLLASAVLAAEPTRVDVFRSDEAGYPLFRIPGLIVTAKGTLLAYAEGRRTPGDWAEIAIVMRRSTDGGQTWSPIVTLSRKPADFAKNPHALRMKNVRADEATFNNPVAIADRSGAVHLIYCLEYKRAFYCHSNDDGQSFSEPVEITSTFAAFAKDYSADVIATGPGHGIQLRSGRLLVPVWLSPGTGGNAHHPSAISTIYSDDGGTTWKRGEIASRPTDVINDPNETTAAELSDGRVMLNVRHQSKHEGRMVLTSPDGATQWSEPRFDEALPEPICFASLVSLGGGRLVFTNPDNRLRGDKPAPLGQGADRKNLTVRLSADDGQSWQSKRVVDAGPSGYSDLAVAPNGDILCLYERGRPIAALTLVRFAPTWVGAAD